MSRASSVPRVLYGAWGNPHLADEEAPGPFPDGPDDADEVISVLDEIAEAGGPDLH